MIAYMHRLAAVLGAVALAAADTLIDFENFAVGTQVTNQYPGVVFSAPPDSCGGTPPVRPVIANPNGGTSSGTRALTVSTGCPDFSPDFIRAVFDAPHGEVSFTLGETAGTYQIRVYTTTSGGSPVLMRNIVLSGTGFLGVHRLVRLTRPQQDIRRVEIDSAVDDFEYIDDLFFDCIDATPPIAEIVDPVTASPVCNGSPVIGSAYDPDTEIVEWRLERKAPTAGDWTLIAVSNTEVINDQLAIWTTSAATGYYYLRLTVENACGDRTQTQTMVYLDKQPPTVNVRWPVDGDIVGGSVCIDGTAWDQNTGSLAVERRPAGVGVFVPVTGTSPPWVVTDTLGSWNTRSGVADGDYDIRVTASDACDNTTALVTTVTVDNTAPLAVITSPQTCTTVGGIVNVFGTATDAHLLDWSLDFTGDGIVGWQNIDADTAPVVANLLGQWDTRGLPACAYTLRLTVRDRAWLDCDHDDHNVKTVYVSVDLGTRCDVNRDGLVNFFDIDPFVECLFGG